MSLQTKTLLFNVLAITGLIAALDFGAARVLLRGFGRVETRSLQRQTGLVAFNLSVHLAKLTLLARDNAAHAELDAFVSGRDGAYAARELNSRRLERLNIDFLAVVNREGEVVYRETSSVAPPPDRRQLLATVHTYLEPGNPILRHESAQDVNVVTVPLPVRPIFIASAPIMTNQYEAPVQGSLVLATPFTTGHIAMLERLDISFILHPLDAPMSGELEEVVGLLEANEAAVQGSGPPYTLARPQDESRTIGYALTRKLGPTPFLLEVNIPRRIYAQALMSRKSSYSSAQGLSF